MQSDTPHEPESAGDEGVSGLNMPDFAALKKASAEPQRSVEERLEAGDDLTDEEWADLERATSPQGGETTTAPAESESPAVAAKTETDPIAEPDDGEITTPAPEVSVESHGDESSGPVTATSVDESANAEGADTPSPDTPASDTRASDTRASDTPSPDTQGANASTDQGDSNADDDVSPVVEGQAVKVEPDTTVDAENSEVAAAPGEAADEAPTDQQVDADSDAPVRVTLNMPLPRVLAVANQKGGVGKTTTTVNIAACLAEQGYRTLLVDLDPQANASTGLGLEPRELAHSVYHVMLHDADADSCIEPTEVKNLFVLPSSLDLAGAEIELVAMMSREHRLRLAIESVIDDYDYVLIDCPPSLGLLTINALTAANEVLVPIQCEYYALEGLGQLMRNVELVKANLNTDLQISHLVLVMFDPRTKLAGQVVDEVRGHFGDLVCENVIPRTVRLSEAPSFGQPITTFDSDSRGASAYRAVTQEVIGGQA